MGTLKSYLEGYDKNQLEDIVSHGDEIFLKLEDSQQPITKESMK